jgi:transcriptional regulator with XRE-family HTH domain
MHHHNWPQSVTFKNPCYNSPVKEILYNMESVPTKIKHLRKEIGLTQRELAEKVGIHPAQLARYESGLSTPSLGVLIKLAQYCEVSIDYLVFGIDKEAARRSRIKDQNLLDLTRRIDNLKRPQRDRIKWAIEGMLNHNS